METVRSKDGTLVAYERRGKGRALVLVHGTAADHTRWAPLLPELGRHFTVYAVDRRGRGQSGDTKPYALEREFEDVTAVVEAAGPQVNLLGHSFGALCAMEAAIRTSNIRKIILYEPPFPVEGVEMFPPGARERLQSLLDQGDRELLLTAFLQDIIHMPEQEIQGLRTDGAWHARLAAAHTLVREMAAAEDYVFDSKRFRKLATPALLLLGEKSPTFLTRPTERLVSGLNSRRVAVLPGQGHVAMSSAPELFLREVIAFLTE